MGRLFINRQVMIKFNTDDISPYQVKHSKCTEYLSFFKDAFPEQQVHILDKVTPEATEICCQYGLILLPPFHAWAKTADFAKKFQIFFNSVHSVTRLSTGKE
jgi:hypothetical protein